MKQESKSNQHRPQGIYVKRWALSIDSCLERDQFLYASTPCLLPRDENPPRWNPAGGLFYKLQNFGLDALVRSQIKLSYSWTPAASYSLLLVAFRCGWVSAIHSNLKLMLVLSETGDWIQSAWTGNLREGVNVVCYLFVLPHLGSFYQYLHASSSLSLK